MNSATELQNKFELLKSNRWKYSLTTADERKAKLLKLKDVILNNRQEIISALYLDFKKPSAEVELTEIHSVIEELNFAIKKLNKWMRPVGVKTPLVLFGSKSKIYYEARGVALIMAPWNYPFYLVISPLISAIAAGCVTFVRPSEKTPQTSLILKKIIEEVFNDNEVSVALGDVEVSKAILDLPFDHIFFTGSTHIGKIVMERASKNLTSVTLELGGKSPVIIDSDVDLDDAVSKIVWGKFLNAGQTCVAPDYVFIKNEMKDLFLSKLKKQIKNSYGETIVDRLNSADFARVIDEVNFDRLNGLSFNEKKLLDDAPSKEASFYMPPTILTDVTIHSEIMKSEIFGPVLPVLTYESLDEVISYIRSNGKPLALYVFSKNKKNIKKILRETSSGGAVINHVVLHLGNPYLPFGGVGPSGMGGSHGYFGFKAFSHERAVMFQGAFTLSNFYFPPYSTWLSKLCYKILKFLE